MGTENKDLEKEPREQNPESIRPLHRGIWADSLDEGKLLPVGGNLMETTLTTKLDLDFSSFENEIGDFKSFAEEEFLKNKDIIEKGLKENNLDIDPKLFCYCGLTFAKVRQILKPEKMGFHKNENSRDITRTEIYNKYNKKPKLSSIREKSECAEIAALGQYLLQKLGIKSAYVSGIIQHGLLSEHHSFIIIDENRNDSSLIFDIARPHQNSKGELLRTIMRTKVPFTYESLKEEKEKLIEAKNVASKKNFSAKYGVMEISYEEMQDQITTRILLEQEQRHKFKSDE